MVLYHSEHVSKPFSGKYSMGNLDVTDFLDLAPTVGNDVSPPFKVPELKILENIKSPF